MEINLTTKFAEKVDERFKLRSLTEGFTGHNYDFTGARTVKVYSVDTVPVGDYSREGVSRYGSVVELGDTVQELTLTQDKAFTFTVDNGNASDQLNIKHAARRLRTNWDEICTPMIDKYRFNIWAQGAGLGTLNDTELTAATVMDALFQAGAEMSNNLVPLNGRAIFIRNSLYVKAKLSDEIRALQRMGDEAIRGGVVGEIDGARVVPVPDSYLPEGVEFIMKIRSATADPVKLHTFRVHKNPPGIDGDLAECRFYYDSFVLGNKANGVYVYAASGMCAPPTVTVTGTTATVTAGTGESVRYTTDGTNPKVSETAKDYTGAVTLGDNETIRVYAYKSGKINSPIVSGS